MPTLLIVDDEPGVCYSFRRVFSGEGVEVVTAATAAAGLQQARARRPDVVVLDLQLPDASGLDLFARLHADDPKRPVIFVTAHGTTDTAIEAMKRGAFDYLVKPVDLERLSQVVARAFEAARLMHVPAALPGEDGGDRLIGRSLLMQEMGNTIGRVAPQDVNVLILGESGAGKELVARALYHHSRRADRPYLAINCAAIPEPLLESELFGHEAGAFTGATRRRVGKFEQCDGGTLFLDEIGDMSPAIQAKMLRVLQDQQFERVGGDEPVRTQVRILAATNHDLEQLVGEGKFRKDLYYRLKVVTIAVPPLRERKEDVAELAHHFLFRFNRELNRDLRGFAPEALALFQQYDWPGNVRELQSAIKEAMLRATGNLLLAEFLPEPLRRAQRAEDRGPKADEALDVPALIEGLLGRGEKDLHAQVIRQVERTLFTRVLRHTHGHQTQASELLGLNRSTLRTKLRDLGVTIDKVPVQEGEESERMKDEG
jgi:two-component system nitrogen regulation response regulator GlnG